jgi:hypothetical protein
VISVGHIYPFKKFENFIILKETSVRSSLGSLRVPLVIRVERNTLMQAINKFNLTKLKLE